MAAYRDLVQSQLVVVAVSVVVILQVTGPVASLQCDVDTTGTAQIVASLTNKQLIQNRLPNGKLRVVVYGLNQQTFSGAFATVDKSVTGISGVVAADPDGTQSSVTVKKLSKPTGLKIK